jgi:hypothetical protein
MVAKARIKQAVNRLAACFEIKVFMMFSWRVLLASEAIG